MQAVHQQAQHLLAIVLAPIAHFPPQRRLGHPSPQGRGVHRLTRAENLQPATRLNGWRGKEFRQLRALLQRHCHQPQSNLHDEAIYK